MEANEKVKKGLGIASMVIGIIGLCYVLLGLLMFNELVTQIADNVAAQGIELQGNTPAMVGAVIGFTFVYALLPTLGLIFALVERRNNKNKFNTTGLYTSLAAYAACVIIIIMFFNHFS